MLTRRQLIAQAGSGAAALAGLGLLNPVFASAQEGIHPRYGPWISEGVKIFRGHTSNPAEQILWTTLMRVDDKIGGTFDRWYLWFWTHDAAICRLYSAPTPLGPFTERGCAVPTPPAGWDPNHFSAGDVVWDPATRYFYATPHGIEAVFKGRQATFLIQSRDGRSWSFVRSDPILPPGPAGHFDGYAANYGRFLRDFFGNVVRVNGGDAVFYYRGTNVHGPEGQRFGVGMAASRDLSNWTKFNRPNGQPLFDPAAGALHGLGSALMVQPTRTVHLVICVLQTVFLKAANSPDNTFSFAPGPGVAIYEHLNGFASGGSYTVDTTGSYDHVMSLAHTRLNAEGYMGVSIIRSVI